MARTLIPLGCSTLGFRLDPLDVALSEIALQGFHLVDIAMYPSYCPHFNPQTATPAETSGLETLLDEHGLTVATLNATDGLLGNPEQREQALAYARACLDLAHRLGAYGVTMQAGVEPPSGQWLEVARAVAPDLRALGDVAAGLGLELTLELHKSMLMATGQEAADLMALVDHPAVGVALDPSHATYAGEDVAEIARALGDLVKHVHLRDAIGQNILVVPGDGTVDFTALTCALGEIGYRRAAVIELEYEDATAAEVRPDLRRAKELLARDFVVA
ncbi:MAG: oxidoreductase domain protein [Thermomicrobiales bacterium]|nr:oxidoreductase domain protein [Thermomicrobiales bacterium]